MRIIKRTYLIIKRIIKRILALAELFLFLRLLLKFLNANPVAPVVNFFYKYSEILIRPFKYIFTDAYWNGKLVETATLSAMIGYIILVFVLLRILNLFSSD
jgi:hypothetical protein